MSFRTSRIALGLVAGWACMAPLAHAGGPAALSGQLLGEVSSSLGVSQMGASVLLYNRYDVLVRQSLSDSQGRFAFDGLAPDLYSIRVSLASFVPAFRRNITVLAGAESLLKINLANVLSTVVLIPGTAAPGTLMTDDWKWVLRASQATRPALRLLPDSSTSQTRAAASLFSETSGLVKLSTGDSDSTGGGIAEDMGTAFALATSIHGATHVRVSGNLAFMPSSGLPAAGFRATYARSSEWGSSPQIALTVRQVYIPSLVGSGAATAALAAEGGEATGPALRTASLVVHDKVDLTDQLGLDYGFAMQSVMFLHRYTYASPFARATYDLGSGASIRLAYSSSIQPSDLTHGAADLTAPGVASNVETGNAPELNQDLAALGQLPRISRLDGRTRVQRNRNYEAGYQKVQGSRTYAVAVYRDSISDASFLLSAPAGFLAPGDAMPDLGSRSMVFDTGNLERIGYQAGITQRAGAHFELQVTAGRGEALAGGSGAASTRGDDLRATIHQVQREWATARVSTTIAATGTRLSTSYGWTDFHVLTPVHESLTGAGTQETGWNISIRQPLPGWFGFRMELTADLRNLLAQGYLPMSSGTQSAILTNAPRGVRSGLSFIF